MQEFLMALTSFAEKLLLRQPLFILALIIMLLLQKQLRGLLSAVVWRVKVGTPVKIASFELGRLYVAPQGDVRAKKGLIEVRKDDGTRYEERGQYYLPNRDLFLVHRLAPSTDEGEVYDILMYLVPHKEATLAGVSKVEYYFGEYWKQRVFTSTHRPSGFSISTSAYGPFVCTAKIYFTDGHEAMVWRYIDFEMGELGPGIERAYHQVR